MQNELDKNVVDHRDPPGTMAELFIKEEIQPLPPDHDPNLPPPKPNQYGLITYKFQRQTRKKLREEANRKPDIYSEDKSFVDLDAWQKSYIIMHADFEDKSTEIQRASKLGVSTTTLWSFRNNFPRFDEYIKFFQNKFIDKVGNRAMKILWEKMNKSPKVLEIALAISQRYDNKQTIVNKFSSEDEARSYIKSKLNSILNKEPKKDST
jgi:hypothetical protein